jgi:hypothetical protein
MFSKTAFLLAFAAVAEFALASPPSCMLATVNTIKEPWKIENVCKTKGITQKMAEACGDDIKVALSAFADLCNKEAGVKVATEIPTSKTSSIKASGTHNATLSVTKTSYSPVVYTTATFDSDCSCTKTGVVTSVTPIYPSGIATSVEGAAGPTGAPPTGAAGSATPTGTGPALSTGAAGKIGAAYAAIVLGGLGAVAAVL